MKKAATQKASAKSPKLRLHKDSLRKLSDAFLKDIHGGGNSTCGAGAPCPCPTPPIGTQPTWYKCCGY